MGRAALFAVLDGWTPWQVVALASVVGLALAALAWAWAWRDVQTRRAELTPLSTDDQAARVLGEALGRCGVFVQSGTAGEVWGAFAHLPSEGKRALAQAVAGHVAELEEFALPGAGAAVARIVLGFAPPRAAAEPAGDPEPDEVPIRSIADAEQVLTAALDHCGICLSEAVAAEVRATFEALPREGKAWLAATLRAHVAHVALPAPGLSQIVAARVRLACEMFLEVAPHQPVTAP
jgi:hypothetical protein